MRIFSNDEIRVALAPFEPALADAIRSAWAQWLAHARLFRFQPAARCRSTTVHELIVQEIRDRFPDRVFSSKGRTMLRVNHGLILQFKKLDKYGLPRNYPTQLALLFTLQISIPGMPPGTRATIGYRTDELGVNLLELAVVIQDHSGVDGWELRETVTPVMPITPPAAATPPRRKARLKPNVAALAPAKAARTRGNDDDNER